MEQHSDGYGFSHKSPIVVTAKAYYLVLDAITPANKLRRQIGLRMWRSRRAGMLEIALDEDGGLELPEMGVCVLAEGSTD